LHPQALRATLASLAHFLLPPRAAPQPSPYTTFPLIPARPAISPPRRPPENSIPLRRAPIHVSPTELSHRRATRKLLIRYFGCNCRQALLAAGQITVRKVDG